MKIGITGIANGGKTVFLTSLLWQLAELDSGSFSLGHDIKLHKFREQKINNRVETFPFDFYRDSLVRGGKWPEKTTDCYKYICEFDRSDWNRININRLKRLSKLQFSDRQRLDFFDFPGERIADAAIAAYSDYEDWSKHVLSHFRSHSDYREAFEPFSKFLKSLDASCGDDLLDKVVYQYKLVLASLIHGYKPFISPSIFLLDQSGSVATPASDEALATSRLVGLSEKEQFVPLTESVCDMFPKLKEKMQSRYTRYRRKIALPLFDEIGSSDRLVVLVDIPSLLSGGVGRYNDNRQVLLDLFETLTDSTMSALFQKLFGFWMGGLKKVAFVATKSDQVSTSDICDGKLRSLLKQMTIRAKRILPDVEFQWFECSAIVSTRAGSTSDTLIGCPIANNSEGRELEFTVSHLPNEWPEDWKAGEYRFPNVMPVVSKNLQIPPEHYGMDRLFKFLIN